ncbi:MAG: methyltransferase domain-containing protein [Lewinellaceae bacterium]|nr:methyltransferase domain-containing protein [Lewinellaceae bacterium]
MGQNPHVDFLRESLRNLRTTGSVARSSASLCRALVENIDPLKAKVVVELGAGDGVITEFLLNRLAPDARLLVFEINEIFIQKLQQRFKDPRLVLLHDSAENMASHFALESIEQVDYVVSGIPFAVLPDALADQIIGECRNWLRPGGLFIQFHYTPHLLGFYRQKFGNARLRFVPWNIPPAFVVTAEKK